ncbi:MAG: peptidoglycan DD-metalloendopeptidase family protein [Gammaproteobacteria bacterium]|nr:peptidoglycan DD-metalloendopeptidase family protein [Gammaproteobacteria bacterium]
MNDNATFPVQPFVVFAGRRAHGLHDRRDIRPRFFGAGESASHPGVHIVRRGDTLYSIAFRYGLDYKELARRNRIEPPYTIYIDQRIRLGGAPREARDGPPDERTTASTAARTKQSEARAKPEPTLTAGAVQTPEVGDESIRWAWPSDGELVGSFSLSGDINKGIDIRGNAGDAVRASADGVVVYAGGGLRGYGKLVIVKHNDRYLSAYGHNRSILVKEGQAVKAGQTVARIGGASGENDVLHFEIRRDGKPRDPLEYLPARS